MFSKNKKILTEETCLWRKLAFSSSDMFLMEKGLDMKCAPFSFYEALSSNFMATKHIFYKKCKNKGEEEIQ